MPDPQTNTDAEVFCRMLDDAESALREGPDGAQWAADIPVPLLRELVAESDELAEFLSDHDELAMRFDAVVAAAKEPPATPDAEVGA